MNFKPDYYKHTLLLVFICSLITMACAGDVSINKDQRVSDGERHRGDISTVNGSIRIGSNCRVEGDCQSVNGKVTVGDKSEVGDLSTVNGRINLGRSITVDGDLASVNGSIEVDTGTKINGEVSTINGKITVYGTQITRDVETINGDVSLMDASTLERNLVIGENKGNNERPHKISIRIADGSVVRGDIIVEDPERSEVTVYLSKGGKVAGEIRGAKVVE